MKKIAIIGSGSWGIALGIHLASMGNSIKIRSTNEEKAKFINEKKRCNSLPNVIIPNNIECTTSFKDVIENADFILHVTPSKYTREIVRQYKEFVDCKNQPIIICSKGMEKETRFTLDEVIEQELPGARIGVLSGPSHAEEVAIGIPTLLVGASKDKEIQKLIQDCFMNEKMRIYRSYDIKGVQLGATLKNIIAFCSGVVAGLEYGDNAFAGLLARGLTEMRRFAEKMGGDANTLYGLSGVGDLIVTCFSEHSRNRRAGKLIAQGKSLEETKKEVGMAIESIDNIEVVKFLSDKLSINMPIVDAVYDILYNNLSPKDAAKKLMTRKRKAEN